MKDGEELLQADVEILAALVDKVRVALVVHRVAEPGPDRVVNVQDACVPEITNNVT